MKITLSQTPTHTVIETAPEDCPAVFQYLYHEYYQFQPTGTPYSNDNWSFGNRSFTEEKQQRQIKPGMSLWCWNQCLNGTLEFTEIKIMK